MALERGTFLEHPAWGLCKIVDLRGEGKIVVRLSDGAEKVILRPFVEKSCKVVKPSEAEARLFPTEEPASFLDPADANLNRGRPCRSCGDRLNVSLTDKAGRWKSCPNCSALNRHDEHVFHRFPSEFGTSEKRASAETPDGRQSWCEDCRRNNGPSAGLMCNQVRG